MVIERANKNKLIITLSSSVDGYGLQRLIDYVKYLEATSKSKAKQAEVDKFAEENKCLMVEKKQKTIC